MSEVLLKEYMDRKICYKCKKAQSPKRTYCMACLGALRYRKPYKKR